VKIPDTYDDSIKDYEDKEIVMGVRPEDVYHKKYSSNAEIPAELDAEVEVVEPLGSEFVVNFLAGDTTFTGRLEPKEEPKMGEIMTLVFDMKKVHFFDKETEETIV